MTHRHNSSFCRFKTSELNSHALLLTHCRITQSLWSWRPGIILWKVKLKKKRKRMNGVQNVLWQREALQTVKACSLLLKANPDHILEGKQCLYKVMYVASSIYNMGQHSSSGISPLLFCSSVQSSGRRWGITPFTHGRIQPALWPSVQTPTRVREFFFLLFWRLCTQQK